jgi:N-acetylglucosaminyl-diphospho-decaprenol L-rhamnosyltransferase
MTASGEQPRAAYAAVVVNYEAGPLLTECVASLLADTTAGGPPELVVIDNGSSDGSVEQLQREHPGTRVLAQPENLGYAGGANAGVAATSAPIVAVCNPDVRVRAGTAAAILGRFDREADLGAVGPIVLEPDGAPYPSARANPSGGDALGHALLGWWWPTNPFTRRYRQLDADPQRPRDVDWVSGAAVWLRRSALEQVGGWDGNYFMYFEDVDLCWRLRRAGWRVAYEPGGSVSHVQGASTERHPYRMIAAHHRSALRFAAKRWHGWRRVLLVPAALVLAVRAAVVSLARAVRPRRGAQG